MTLDASIANSGFEDCCPTIRALPHSQPVDWSGSEHNCSDQAPLPHSQPRTSQGIQDTLRILKVYFGSTLGLFDVYAFFSIPTCVIYYVIWGPISKLLASL